MKLNRVLFILPSLHAGGTENYALRFIRFCRSQDIDWLVWSVLAERGDLQGDFEAEGCRIEYRSIGYLNPFKVLQLALWLKKNKVHVLVNFNGNFAGLSMWLAKSMGIPKRVVWYHRSSNAFAPGLFKNSYNQWVNTLVRRHASYILSNSQNALDYFFGEYAKDDGRFQVIPNGVNAAEYRTSKTKEEARAMLGLPKDGCVVGHVGRYDPAKNHETIFNVIERCKQSGLDLFFFFCGKDTDGIDFQKKLQLYGIEDRVYAIGLSQDMALVYACMDLFYFPSITEGQPNALLEAMIAGLPFVASDIAAIRESVPEFAYERLLPPTDVDAAVEKIKNEMHHPWDKTPELQEWAIRQYDSIRHYEQFKRILIGD
jgi:glycosyltransferase involved in cell wall biosynthesis